MACIQTTNPNPNRRRGEKKHLSMELNACRVLNLVLVSAPHISPYLFVTHESAVFTPPTNTLKAKQFTILRLQLLQTKLVRTAYFLMYGPQLGHLQIIFTLLWYATLSWCIVCLRVYVYVRILSYCSRIVQRPR